MKDFINFDELITYECLFGKYALYADTTMK